MTDSNTTFTLQAEVREELGKEVNKLRKEGKLPAILYGHGIKNNQVTVNYKEFEVVYRQAGSSSLVDLVIGKQKPVKVVIQEVQRDPVSEDYIHADFYQVKMTEKITTEVSLKFIGESKAVKEEGGILIKTLDSLKIESLPQDLVKEIEVDISTLNSFDDIIRIKDLVIPSGISIREQLQDTVASVQPPRTEQELEDLEQTVEEKVEEVEGMEKKKEESEEGEEDEEKPAEEKEKKEKVEPKK